MSKSHIYLRDDLLTREYDGKTPRRTIDQMYTILTEIIPLPPHSMKQQRLGFLAYYQHDIDVNFIYKPENKAKLQQNQLTARLSYETENNRDIYILKTPLEIYNKSETNLTIELEERNAIQILKLDKFINEKSSKKYIKITLESKESRDELVKKGFINLF